MKPICPLFHRKETLPLLNGTKLFSRNPLLGAVLASVVLLPSINPLNAAEWHVAPGGAPEGDGSKIKPWDLKTALAQPAAVKPGDTIWLHAGTYAGHFQGNLKGAAQAPIIVRQFPGERAVIDGNFNRRALRDANVFEVAGAYTWYWGFEITSSYPNRKYDTADYAVVEKPWGLDVGNGGNVPAIKLINLVIHDTSQGPGVWRGAADQELYGCIIFNNGYDAPDRGHGHGTYTQNETGPRWITDNIIFNQYGYGIHAYGSSRAFLNDFRIEGNILFDNGAASAVSGYNANILVGGGRVAERPVIRNNYSYFPPLKTSGIACQLNYGQGTTNAVLENNYFISGGRAFALKGGGAGVSGNVFVGPVAGFDPNDFPDNSFDAEPPSGLRVFVRPNKYEPGRAHICVFNWDRADKAFADVSAVLKPGAAYEVRDAQNLFGPPVAKGTYDGQPINLPLNLTQVTQPTGHDPKPIAHTPIEFNAFVLTTVSRPDSSR